MSVQSAIFSIAEQLTTFISLSSCTCPFRHLRNVNKVDCKREFTTHTFGSSIMQRTLIGLESGNGKYPSHPSISPAVLLLNYFNLVLSFFSSSFGVASGSAARYKLWCNGGEEVAHKTSQIKRADCKRTLNDWMEKRSRRRRGRGRKGTVATSTAIRRTKHDK